MSGFVAITVVIAILSIGLTIMYHGFTDFLQAVPIVQHTLTFDRLDRVNEFPARYLLVNELIHSTTPIPPGLSPIPTPSYDLVYSNCVMELGFPMKFTVPRRKDRYWSIQMFDPLGRSAMTLSSRFFTPQINDSVHSNDRNIWSLMFHHSSDKDKLDINILDGYASIFPMPHRYYYIIIRIESVVQNQTDFQSALEVQKLMTLERIYPESKSEEGKFVPKGQFPHRDVSDLSLTELFSVASTTIAANPDTERPIRLHSHASNRVTSSIYMFGAWLGRSVIKKAVSSKAVGYISVEKLRTTTTEAFTQAIISWKYTYPNDDREARYYSTFSDVNNQPLNGGKLYRLDIPAPPSGAFWSVSVYNANTAQMIANPQAIYSKGNDLLIGKSFSVYISHISPSEFIKKGKLSSLNVPFASYHEQSNVLSMEDIDAFYWLPAPPQEFYLVVRIYAPLYESDKDYFPPLPSLISP